MFDRSQLTCCQLAISDNNEKKKSFSALSHSFSSLFPTSLSFDVLVLNSQEWYFGLRDSSRTLQLLPFCNKRGCYLQVCCTERYVYIMLL